MYQLLDGYGKPVNLGSTLIYAGKHINYGYVYGIKLRNDEYSLSIIAMTKTWRGEHRVYRTILTADNFIVAEIDKEIKLQLMKKV